MTSVDTSIKAADTAKRTNKALKNIGGLFVMKGVGIGARLMLVPMTLNYLEAEKFGIWLTLSSIIEMLILFEFGLGNGLRNKLSESLANKKIELARTYISTTYALSAMILVPLFIILLIINQFINWPAVLNASVSLGAELNELVSWMLLFYGFKLFFGLILSITKANHLPVLGGILELIADLVALLTIYLLIEYTDRSLLYLGGMKFLIISIVPMIGNIVFYKTVFKKQIPAFRYVEFKKFREVLKLSWRFFVIHVSSLIIFSTDNIIISRLFGPENVTPYAIIFQYFNLVTVFFAIVSTPLWSAYTDAYVKGDYLWIIKVIKKMLLLWLCISGLVLFMINIASDVVEFWLGRVLDVDSSLIILMGVYVLVQAWNRIFSWVLNGIGEVNVTMYSMVLGALINVPMSIYLADKLELGSSGVILGTILSLMIFLLFGTKKTINLINTKSKVKD